MTEIRNISFTLFEKNHAESAAGALNDPTLSLAEGCLNYIATDLEKKIDKTQALVKSFFTVKNNFINDIDNYKRLFISGEVSLSSLPCILIRFSQTLPQKASELLKGNPERAALQEVEEGLAFLEGIIKQNHSSTYNYLGFFKKKRIETLSNKVASLKQIEKTIQSERERFAPLVDKIHRIQELSFSFNALFEKEERLFTVLDLLNSSQQSLEKLKITETQFLETLADYYELKTKILTLHQEYPALFEAHLKDLKERLTKDRKLFMSLSKSNTLQFIPFLKEALKEVTFPEVLDKKSPDFLFFAQIAQTYREFAQMTPLPKECAIAYDLVQKVEAYHRVLDLLTHHRHLEILQDDLFLLSSLDEKSLIPLKEKLSATFRFENSNSSPQRQRKLFQALQKIASICPKLLDPFLTSWMTSSTETLKDLPSIDHKKHLAVFTEEVKELMFASMFELLNQDRLHDISLSFLLDFHSLSPDYSVFQQLLVERLKQRFLIKESAEKLASFLCQLKRLLCLRPEFNSSSLQKLFNNIFLSHPQSALLMKAFNEHSYPINQGWETKNCAHCIQECIDLDLLDELSPDETLFLYRSFRLKEVFRTHVQEIFENKTLKELKRFRKEQLDPFLQKNSNFKSVDFVQDFIKKTDTGFSLISFFTDLILCLVSFLFSFNRHPNNSKN